MAFLIAGLLVFLGNHSIHLVMPAWRKRFIDQYGVNTWKLLFSVFSLLGLFLIIHGYGLTREFPVFVWNPPVWTRHSAILLNLLAFILLAATFVKHNHFKMKLGHPMYAGVKLWSFAHLISNGRLGDVLLFASFLIWAVAGFSMSRRRDRLNAVTYPAANGKSTLLTVVAGSVAWAVFAFWLHVLLIGVPPL